MPPTKYTQISKKELLKLLEEHGSLRGVARALGCDKDTVGRMMGYHGINYRPAQRQFTIGEAPTEKKIDILAEIRKSVGKPYIIQPLKPSEKEGETLVIQLTDWHIGAIVRDEQGKEVYNEKIAKERIGLLCSKILYLIKDHISYGTKLSEIAVLITGDLVEGEGVFPTQSYFTELAPPTQVITALNVLRGLINSLLKFNLPVNVYAVKGNHGRTSKETNPTSNWDLMLFLVFQDWLKQQKIKNVYFKFSEGDYLNANIQGWNFQLRHEGPAQIETAAGAVRASGWHLLHGIDGLVYGHFHHFNLGELAGRIRTFMGPSLKGTDEYSESLAKGSNPAQLIWGVSKKHLSTFHYVVDLK